MKTILPTSKPLLLLICFAMNAHSAPDKTVFDFQSPTNAAWQIVNDDVMGGVSASSFRITNGVAVFSGEVSLANNGGFASVRSLPARHDLGAADTFVVRVRGDVPPLNPAKVSSVGFLISDQQAGPFQLEVTWIKASPAAGK